LAADDVLRDKKRAHQSGYDYYSNEDREFPVYRTYETYQTNGTKAIKLNEAEYKRRLRNKDKTAFNHIDVDGVYGLWCLKDLPYAADIYWTTDFMHTTNNVCHDMLNSIRPTHSQISGAYYGHNNRTYDDKVVAACQDEKIFRCIYGALKPDWVLEVNECIEIDRLMNNIMGQLKSQELVKNVMRAGRGEKSHDTIYWCIVYARFFLYTL
jgi:hypothetical protein